MIFRQIGNGGAFDYNSINSSFVIENNDKYILFDCGYSVYAELRRLDADINENFNIEKLSSVYISHMDDDHMGSLKTLCFYMYFIHNTKLEILVDECDVHEDLSVYMTDMKNYVDIAPLSKDKITTLNGLSLNTVETSGHHLPCTGLIISEILSSDSLYITGDTKASNHIRKTIRNLDDLYQNIRVFHDFSNWDDEEKQVHACKTDTDRVFEGFTLKHRIEWYHNNKEFNNKWQNINIKKDK